MLVCVLCVCVHVLVRVRVRIARMGCVCVIVVINTLHSKLTTQLKEMSVVTESRPFFLIGSCNHCIQHQAINISILIFKYRFFNNQTNAQAQAQTHKRTHMRVHHT